MRPHTPPPARDDITADLARRMVSQQFPAWRHLEVTPVVPGGWDNRTFRLGRDLLVRMPSAATYRHQPEKEQTWLPRLAPRLPLQVPVPEASGEPGPGFPWRWSVFRWIDGESATPENVRDLASLATTLGEFLVALRNITPAEGPPPGEHNFFRGGPLETYDSQTREAIVELKGTIDAGAVTQVWERSLQASWRGSPVWVHGDVSAGNLLVRDGKLQAVIDFGSSGVGDPACDLVIAWTLLYGTSRDAFRNAVGLDEATWMRARGWAVWKALITLRKHLTGDRREADSARGVIDAVVSDRGD